MQTIMKKGIIFKHNSRLKFSQLLQNCWPPTAVHKRDPMIRLINTPLRMCRGIEMHVLQKRTRIWLVIMT